MLHMSIASLDLDQVIRLCEAHRLYSALAYVHNRILDYRRPLVDLLAAVARADSLAEQQQYGYKLLVYLRWAGRLGAGRLDWIALHWYGMGWDGLVCVRQTGANRSMAAAWRMPLSGGSWPASGAAAGL